MARLEFSKQTKREALKRSGHVCEAGGERYGLPSGVRCQSDLAYGVEYDHAVPDALKQDNSLDNCLAVCVKCHRFKTKNDVKQIAKSNRQRDKNNGIRSSKNPIKSVGFSKAPPQKSASRPLTKRVGYFED